MPHPQSKSLVPRNGSNLIELFDVLQAQFGAGEGATWILFWVTTLIDVRKKGREEAGRVIIPDRVPIDVPYGVDES